MIRIGHDRPYYRNDWSEYCQLKMLSGHFTNDKYLNFFTKKILTNQVISFDTARADTQIVYQTSSHHNNTTTRYLKLFYFRSKHAEEIYFQNVF